MIKPEPTMARQVARAVMAFQQKTTGHAPKAITVVLSQDTLVVTLHEALSPAEKDMAKKSPAGAAKVQEFHRQLFFNSSQSLREEIKRITGVEVREAAAEVETVTGTMVPLAKAATTVPVVVSTSAAASRTSTPVILLISCRSGSEELVKSCR